LKEGNFDLGVKNIKVTMIDWPKEPWRVMDAMMKATWSHHYSPPSLESINTELIEKALQGGALGNAMEALQFTFAISGVSRAFTHQLVRQRIGFVFAQEGGRDNDWSHFDYTIPDTIFRAGLADEFVDIVEKCRVVYSKAIAAGVPYQDARFICPIATRTYIVVSANYRALQGFLARRLCNLMQWEINWVARLIVGQMRRVLPKAFHKGLQCACDVRQRCCAINPTLFPPCGLWPASEELQGRSYTFPSSANGCQPVIGHDKQLGYHWIPEGEDS